MHAQETYDQDIYKFENVDRWQKFSAKEDNEATTNIRSLIIKQELYIRLMTASWKEPRFFRVRNYVGQSQRMLISISYMGEKIPLSWKTNTLSQQENESVISGYEMTPWIILFFNLPLGKSIISKSYCVSLYLLHATLYLGNLYYRFKRKLFAFWVLLELFFSVERKLRGSFWCLT